VVRDLIVDRTRMFDAIEIFSCWNDVDCKNTILSDFNIISAREADRAINYIGCMMCGACLEACPQINSRSPYVGAFVFSQAMALNLVPSGLDRGHDRISASMQRGGLADCGASGNCSEVCPAGIDLPSAISEFGYIAGRYSLRSFLRG
ncbi:MAG: 4Fe-4S dicluster domain-containing protein, partial [Deltaproteobacteria bacterium]|nr:4Fe-4S dicluster domain-containing protein [Deltaproteobacteria bacterium]